MPSQSIQTVCNPIACAPATSPCGSSPTYHVRLGPVPSVCRSASKALRRRLLLPDFAAYENGPAESGSLRLADLQGIPPVAQDRDGYAAIDATLRSVVRTPGNGTTNSPTISTALSRKLSTWRSRGRDAALGDEMPHRVVDRKLAAPLTREESVDVFDFVPERSQRPSALTQHASPKGARRRPARAGCRSPAYGRDRNRSLQRAPLCARSTPRDPRH